MNLKHLLFKLIPFMLPLSAYCVNFDSNMQLLLDPLRPLSSSHICFAGNLYDSFWNDQKGWLVSNRIFLTPTSIPTFSCSAGMRHNIRNHAIGHFGFVNMSHQFNHLIYQTGVSLDCIHKWYEVRMNYHHPKKFEIPAYFFNLRTFRKVEMEVIGKVQGIHFGGGPIYNFTTHKAGGQWRVSIPFNFFSVGVHFQKVGDEPAKLGVFTSFNFFGKAPEDKLFNPSIYSHFPVYSIKPLKPKKEKNHTDSPVAQETPSPEVSTIIEDIIDYKVEPVEPEIIEEKGWLSDLYEWFWPQAPTYPAFTPKHSYINPLLQEDRLPFPWEYSPGHDIPEEILPDFPLSLKRFYLPRWQAELGLNDFFEIN